MTPNLREAAQAAPDISNSMLNAAKAAQLARGASG